MALRQIPFFLFWAFAALLAVLAYPSHLSYDTSFDATTAGRQPEARSLLSNAERMARGLGPKEPRSLYEPSRTRSLLPRTSNVATTPYYIEVAYASAPDTIVGYLTTPSTGSVQLVSTTSAADTYYAPDNVPATSAVITTNSLNYGTYYPWLYPAQEGTDSNGIGVYHFRLRSIVTGTNVFDISDFPDLDITLVPAGTELKLYINPSNSILYGGASAASINANSGTSIAETNEIYLNFVAK